MTRADIAVLAVLGAALVGLYARLWVPPAPTGMIEIVVDDRVLHRLRPDQTRILEVSGARGISRIEIERGRARFIASPCTRKICLRAGWQSRAGAVAACVPNHVALVLVGAAGELDGLSY